jgi:hypothetical protein
MHWPCYVSMPSAIPMLVTTAAADASTVGELDQFHRTNSAPEQAQAVFARMLGSNQNNSDKCQTVNCGARQFQPGQQTTKVVWASNSGGLLSVRLAGALLRSFGIFLGIAQGGVLV